MNPCTPDDAQQAILHIAAEAADWYVRLDSCGEAEKQRFARWLAHSPRHLEEFLRVTALAEDIRHCAQHPLDSYRQSSGSDDAKITLLEVSAN